MPGNDRSELQRRIGELHALIEVAKTLTTPLDIPELLQAVMSKLFNVIDPADFGLVMLWDHAAGLFRSVATFGLELEMFSELGLRAGESIIGKAFDAGYALLFQTPEAVAKARENLRSANRAIINKALGDDRTILGVVAAPLIVGQRKYGVLVLGSLQGPTEFAEEDVPFVQTLADLIALAIDRARLENEATAIRDAEQVERLRSEVMATLSHELRTPLAAIKGYSTALLIEEIEWSEDKQREFLQLIDVECDNLQTMISDILDSSLIDVGQLTIAPQPVRMPRLAQEIADDMQRRSDIHRLVVDFRPDFPLVDADPHWIRQVFRNILDNSLKYSPDGGLIMIKGEVRDSDVVISIADQGVGISPEDLIPLFEKYFRVKAATGHYVAGTGLGLPVARAIVEAHQGRIWAESKVGHGTTLFFSLPLTGLSAELDD
jgi:signal transduction histidine kinase